MEKELTLEDGWKLTARVDEFDGLILTVEKEEAKVFDVSDDTIRKEKYQITFDYEWR